jgi:peptidoglycan/LPS O-acetylase OafA/YrhL
MRRDSLEPDSQLMTPSDVEAARVQPTRVAGSNWLRLRRITSSSHRYIAEVDGLRFIAIFSVLFFHVVYLATHVDGAVLRESPLGVLLRPFQYGYRGVELFFVISGFILGLPFAQHYLAGGKVVRPGRYYLRRLTRLEPPYIVALLGFYAAAVLLRMPDVTAPGFWSGLPLRLGYAYDIVRGTYPTLNGVTWSLEIEVQFYLLAPLLARVFKLGAGLRRLLLCSAICAVPLLAPLVPGSRLTLLGFAHLFLMGFLLADLHVTASDAKWPSRRAWDLLGTAALLVLALVPESRWFSLVFAWILAGAFLAALRGGWFRAVLQLPWVAVLGGMCYSLYLLHLPLLSFMANRIVRTGMSVPAACLLVGLIALPLAILAGAVYYVLLERPCMNPNWPRELGERITRLLRRRAEAV